MLELHINDTDLTHGSIPLSWCSDKATIQKCLDDGCLDPQLIICIAPKEGYHISKEVRKVIPLKDLMTYVEFYCAGKNNIFGLISNLTNRVAKDRYLSKDYGKYETSFLTADGTEFKGTIVESSPDFISTPISVDVPEKCFAKEPWDKAWVNWLFKYSPEDQCSFRKRRLFSYSIQPLIMLGDLFVRTFYFIIALLIGSKGLTLKYYLHPLTYNISASMKVVDGGTYFIRKGIPEPSTQDFWPNVWWVITKGWTVPFMPVIAIPIFFFYRIHHLLHLGLTFVAVILLFFVVGFFVTGTAKDLFYDLMDKLMGPEKFDEAEIEQLICDGSAKSLNLSQLPKNKRTIKLRFYDLKSKVCRPYSR